MSSILTAIPVPSYSCGLVWFRRDLRAHDHAALYHALRACQRVFCVFVFDTDILDSLPRQDRRVQFIADSVAALDAALRQRAEEAGVPQAELAAHGLIVRHASATKTIAALADQLGAEAVFANHDDEPAAQLRDDSVRQQLAQARRAFHTYKDHTIFEREELLTLAGQPYSVFTPYKRAWLQKVDNFYLRSYDDSAYARHLAPRPKEEQHPMPTVQALGFAPAPCPVPSGEAGAAQLWADFAPRLARYDETRDFPAIKGPSYLSVHLRFGTISPRQLARHAHAAFATGDAGAATWLGELIWRDFYVQILSHHPHVAERSFKAAYDAIEWEQGEEAEQLFTAWCNGQTGFPLVDAAMRQLLHSGYMHNRLRMVVASFLCKDLGLDWRRGEAFFALHLNDFDLSANNGGWQWASSSGCDAQPYFRIFNPESQSRKFDAEGQFIRRYVPELAGLSNKAIHAPEQASPIELQAAGVVLGQTYPRPVVNHAEARQKTLLRYAVVKTPD